MRCAVLAVVPFVLVAGPTTRADDRAPVPSAEAVEKAEGTVRELFKAEYAKTKAADRAALAAKLVSQAADTANDPAAKFALLRDARDLAAKAADPTLCFRAADEMAAAFRISPAEAKLPAAPTLAAAADGVVGARAAAEALQAAADQAVTEEQWEAAAKLLLAADQAARKGSAPLQAAVRARAKQVDAIRAEAEQVAALRETLKVNPSDPAANAGVGRYLCLVVRRWDDGLPLLAKGGDPKLKDAAGKDMKATAGADPFDQLAAADGWYDAAADLTGLGKTSAQVRAHKWYAGSVGLLSGLNKTKAEKRAAELQAVADKAVDKNQIWVDLRAAVAAKKVKRWDLIGGTNHPEMFEEVPAAGAVLIGFRYTLIRNGNNPGVVQPIWLTGRGEVIGRAYGTAPAGVVAQVTKAKPGYAVGAIVTRAGTGFDSLQPVYMKMTDKGLNPADKYDGPKVGGNGGREGTLGGDGNFIIGLHGKVRSKKDPHVETMAPITLTAVEPVDDGDGKRPGRVLPKKP